jgi:prefoldin subunit 5
MQYVSLSKIPNKYPTVNNYTKFKEGVVELSGLYPERNKINFQLPKYEDITPIDNTTFRFVISVLADENDTSPKFFTSKTFYNDIKLAYKVNNPFFPIQALIGNGSILTINLKQYFEIFEKLEKDEKEAPVDVVKNIFITNTEETDASIQALFAEIESINPDIDKLNIDISEAETELIKQSTTKQNEKVTFITKLKARNAKSKQNSLNDVITTLKTQRDSLITKKNKLQNNINELMKAVNNSLLSNNSVIDYEALIKFIDFMVKPQTFELDGIETNNVIKAESIGEWAGEYISAYKRRLAGEFIQATTIDERITPPKSEEDGPKTVVGKILQKIGNLPVIKQVVGAVKAVGKFLGKLFSDSRLKTDIVKVGQIEDINIYKFKFKFNKSKTQIGVIAQELLNTKYADCVSTDPSTGFYVVNYNILQQKIDIIGAIDRVQKEILGNKNIFTKLRNRIESPKPAYNQEVPTKQLSKGGLFSKLENNAKSDVGNTIFKRKRK